jgi:hypothetical protein
MDRESIKRMSHALKAYSKVRDLRKMTKSELAYMPKEVIITCASNEIAHVWDKLPQHLQEDPDVVKYRFCVEHQYDCDGADVNDGPPTRRLFCCYCKVQDITVGNNNDVEMVKNDCKDSQTVGSFFCCNQ